MLVPLSWNSTQDEFTQALPEVQITSSGSGLIEGRPLSLLFVDNNEGSTPRACVFLNLKNQDHVSYDVTVFWCWVYKPFFLVNCDVFWRKPIYSSVKKPGSLPEQIVTVQLVFPLWWLWNHQEVQPGSNISFCVSLIDLLRMIPQTCVEILLLQLETSDRDILVLDSLFLKEEISRWIWLLSTMVRNVLSFPCWASPMDYCCSYQIKGSMYILAVGYGLSWKRSFQQTCCCIVSAFMLLFSGSDVSVVS